MGKTASKLAFAVLAVALAAAAFLLAARGQVERQSFKAFYCAGTAVRERQDPYRVEPLRSCERTIERAAMPAGYVEPAPLPGYALVPFAALSMLPPRAAAVLLALALALAAIVAARALSAVVPAPDTAVLLAFVPLTLLNVAYGEIAPLAMLAVCASAFFLARERWIAAGCAAALAAVQPNVGLPAAVAVFAFFPRTRAAVALTAGALAALSLVALGLTTNLEYFNGVLPLMAVAELVASDQYSLARLLFAAGASPAAALLAGKVWFVCIAVASIVLAGRLGIKGRRPEMVALLPPACVLLFGIYLHDIQMIVALPAALALATRARANVARVAGATAVTLLAAVWTQRAGAAVVVLDAAAVAGALYAVLGGNAARRLVLAAAAAFAAIVCLTALQRVEPPLTAAAIVTHGFDAAADELAPVAWGRYLRATPALTRSAFGPQIFGWLGLLGLLACALAEATLSQSESRERRLASAPYSES
jgi:Glycosyltransferase family 87